jgi:Domain of unknown function (DUF4129)
VSRTRRAPVCGAPRRTSRSRSARRLAIVAATALALLCAAPAAARADAVSPAQLRDLAARAEHDPGALAALRRVDRVGARRVDLAAALRGARGAALRARLRELQAPAAAAPAAGAQVDARDILAQERFHGSDLPGPFHGLLVRLSRWLHKLDGVFDWLNDLLPGGDSVVWIVLAVLVCAIAAVVARRVLSGRVRASEAAAAAARAEHEDARALERRADRAEAAGDLATALRLRFRAGLLRLDERGAIEFRPSISTHEVRRALRSEDFDSLAATFDDVVYGGRPPAEDDLSSARERWPRVVAGTGRTR